MESKNSRLNIGLWKRIAVFIAILLVVDLLLILQVHMRFGDLLFIEGMLIFGAGAWIASGAMNLRRESWQTLTASPEGHKEFLEAERSKQVSDGIILMIVGAVIMSLAIASSLV
jgi:hypothetical protein